ncbi:lysoplasmalogenase TMEM86A-like isoform X2 [Ornithodoros turicata]
MEEEVIDHWTSPKIVLKCVGPKLVPFFKSVAIYFVLAISRQPSWFGCLLKCLPIVFLGVFVVLHGISLGDKKHCYSRRILFGLCFSCLGDALLVWPSGFLAGMLSFGVAHLFYISAFKMDPLNPWAGAVCLAILAGGSALLMPGLYGVYTWAVPFYGFLLMFMVWRGVSRVRFFDDLWTWTKLCSCFGCILFAASDCIIALKMFFLRESPPYTQHVIMMLYYAAQLGVALSVVDSRTMAVISAASESKVLPARQHPSGGSTSSAGTKRESLANGAPRKLE